VPTKREREYYQLGFRDGMRMTAAPGTLERDIDYRQLPAHVDKLPKRKRKLSAWNKYVKANSKKPRFRYRNGKLNLKKMAVAFRKTPAGKKKRR
jgi:hypothetical protein